MTGGLVGFVDPRRFGSMDLVRTDAEDTHRLLAGLGPEPLDRAFNAKGLSAALAGKRTPIKAALLDQRVVAGLGNIYVCEALFRAGIAPSLLAGEVAGARARRLVPQIKATLTEAIAAGGSSLRDYVQPSGELGYFQHAWKVYGREGGGVSRLSGAAPLPRDRAGSAGGAEHVLLPVEAEMSRMLQPRSRAFTWLLGAQSTMPPPFIGIRRPAS